VDQGGGRARSCRADGAHRAGDYDRSVQAERTARGRGREVVRIVHARRIQGKALRPIGPFPSGLLGHYPGSPMGNDRMDLLAGVQERLDRPQSVDGTAGSGKAN